MKNEAAPTRRKLATLLVAITRARVFGPKNLGVPTRARVFGPKNLGVPACGSCMAIFNLSRSTSWSEYGSYVDIKSIFSTNLKVRLPSATGRRVDQCGSYVVEETRTSPHFWPTSGLTPCRGNTHITPLQTFPHGYYCTFQLLVDYLVFIEIWVYGKFASYTRCR